MIDDLVNNSGLALYEAIAAGDLDKIKSIVESDLRPDLYEIRKEGAEQNILIVAGNRPEIVKYLVTTYSDELFDEYKLDALFKAIENDYSEMFDNYEFEENKEKISYLMKMVALLKITGISYKGNEVFYDDFLLSNHTNMVELNRLLTLLLMAIPYQDNEAFYKAAILLNPKNTLELARLFSFLIEANIPYQENRMLYITLMQRVQKDIILADKYEELFILLKQANLVCLENMGFCKQLLMLDIFYIDKLIEGFKILYEGKIFYQNNEALYQALISYAISAKDLAKIFVFLKNAGATYENETLFYKEIFKVSYGSHRVIEGFEMLHSAKIFFQGNKALYWILLQNVNYASNLARLFVQLNHLNITYPANIELYKKLFITDFSLYADMIVRGLWLLEKANFIYQENIGLYYGLIDKFRFIDTLAPLLVQLKTANISYLGNEKLYQAVIDNIQDNSIHEFKVAFELLYQSGINYQNFPEYFNANLLITNCNLVLYILNSLSVAGYSFKTHENLFHALLKQLNTENLSQQIVLNVVNQACDYAKRKGLLTSNDPGFKKQLKDLEDIVEINASILHSIEQGPLNKSEATSKIEKILEKICSLDINKHKLLSFNASNHYILNLPNEQEINLSLLIKNANLSQLNLSDKLMAKMAEKLKNLLSKGFVQNSSNPIVKIFPEVQQMAIEIYVTEYYKNINKLFRSEPLVSSKKFNTEDEKNMMACFMLGCLLNDAVNKMNVLVDNLPQKMILDKIACHHNVNMCDYIQNQLELISLVEKSYQEGVIKEQEYLLIKNDLKLDFLYPKISLLDRGECLSEEIIKGRIANPWTFPALTSFSAHTEGSHYFHKTGTIRTKLENFPKCYIINSDEGEVLFPQGTQNITNQGTFKGKGQNSGYLISMITRSPSLEPKNHYWSELALVEAFENYLSKEYAEEASAITLNGKLIVRPNHNITHTYPVMLNTKQVTNYFSHFSKDKDFKAFCRSLTDDEKEWLRVAAAFSITGRESEIRAGDNLALYEKYRQASCEHFMKFVDKTTDNTQLFMKERMSNIVRYMGNPNYESQINKHPDEKERQTRNFYHRILTIAHKMDLPRCYSAKEYNQAMQFCKELSQESKAQQNALEEIVRYNIDLIKAYGSKLHCDIQADGKIVDTAQDYKEIFAEASDIKRLFEITKTITKPRRILGSDQTEMIRLEEESSKMTLVNNNKKHKLAGNENISVKKIKPGAF